MAEKITMTGPETMALHVKRYLETDGAVGHHADFSPIGGPSDAPCLLLKTKGRRSGEAKIAPLIYGEDGKNDVIIASKGGAPDDPAWFLNLTADPEVEVQVGSRKYRGKARVAEGAERERLWAMMAKIYPPYDDYQAKTSRRIPVVVLEPQAEIDKL